MFQPAFAFNLGYAVLPGRVCAGTFDGHRPSLACASSGGKVIVHNPHQGDDAVNSSAISLLNFNREISCLEAGSIDASDQDRDLLFIGTPTSLTAYEVDRNRDAFHIEAPDGANAMAIGKFTEDGEPLAIIGGSCSIYGYNKAGDDVYWTVTGDNVSALALAPIMSSSNHNDLLVGSEDYDLRVFSKDADMLHEFSQQEAVTHLCTLSGQRFGFALSNGVVGVYDTHTIQWSHKLKTPATSLLAFDIDLDGVPELVIGYATGAYEVRTAGTGDVVVQDKFPDPVAGFATIDYRQEGFPSLLAVSTAGHVRGYHALGTKEATGLAQTVMVQDMDTARLQRLKQRKQDLEYQLRKAKAAKPDIDETTIVLSRCTMELDVCAVAGKGLEITVSVSEGCVCRAVILSGSSSLFGTDTRSYHSTEPSNTFTVYIVPSALASFDIVVDALVADSNESTVWRSMQAQATFPAFFGLAHVAKAEPPLIKTALMVPSVSEVCKWLDDQLLAPGHTWASFSEPACLESIADGSIISLQVKNGMLLIGSNNDQLAGDLTSALTSQLHLKVVQVPSAVRNRQVRSGSNKSAMAGDAPANMDPAELAQLVAKDATANPDDMKYLLTRIGDLHKARQRLSAEIADGSNLVKALLLRAEDHRLMGDIHHMREAYSQLHAANRDLLTAYSIRATNHEELVQCLKALNQIIQNTARLQPAGDERNEFVAACRECIKANDMLALYTILQATGRAPEDV